MRILGADGIAFFNPVKRQHDRRQHVCAVAERGVGRLHAEHHVRETQQRFLNRLLQLVGVYLIAHADDMPRYAGDGFVGVIQKNFGITIRTKQRKILEQIHCLIPPKID